MFSPDLELTKTCNAYSAAQSCPTLCKPLDCSLGSPGSASGKNLPASAGEASSIPGSGRSLGEGNDNPLQYYCLGNPMDRGACRAVVHGVTKELDRTC